MCWGGADFTIKIFLGKLKCKMEKRQQHQTKFNAFSGNQNESKYYGVDHCKCACVSVCVCVCQGVCEGVCE
jgi:hypothetical protein